MRIYGGVVVVSNIHCSIPVHCSTYLISHSSTTKSRHRERLSNRVGHLTMLLRGGKAWDEVVRNWKAMHRVESLVQRWYQLLLRRLDGGTLALNSMRCKRRWLWCFNHSFLGLVYLSWLRTDCHRLDVRFRVLCSDILPGGFASLLLRACILAHQAELVTVLARLASIALSSQRVTLVACPAYPPAYRLADSRNPVVRSGSRRRSYRTLAGLGSTRR